MTNDDIMCIKVINQGSGTAGMELVWRDINLVNERNDLLC